uniref:Uncharacterized protein n=1 Tax=Glossina austeni TaxID=7395 RepID=A0A1A9V1G7_GLOAU
MFFKRRKNSNTTSERSNLKKKILLNKHISKIVSEADIIPGLTKVAVFDCQRVRFFVCHENIRCAPQALAVTSATFIESTVIDQPAKSIATISIKGKKKLCDSCAWKAEKIIFFCFASTGYVVIANPCNSPETSLNMK